MPLAGTAVAPCPQPRRAACPLACCRSVGPAAEGGEAGRGTAAEGPQDSLAALLSPFGMTTGGALDDNEGVCVCVCGTGGGGAVSVDPLRLQPPHVPNSRADPRRAVPAVPRCACCAAVDDLLADFLGPDPSHLADGKMVELLGAFSPRVSPSTADPIDPLAALESPQPPAGNDGSEGQGAPAAAPAVKLEAAAAPAGAPVSAFAQVAQQPAASGSMLSQDTPASSGAGGGSQAEACSSCSTAQPAH